MNLRRHVTESIYNIFRAKLRSFLAILGILVGTASVVALITGSQLATEHALGQFKKLGTELLSLNINNINATESSHQLTLADLPQLKNASNKIREVALYTSLYLPTAISDATMGQYNQVIGATEVLSHIMKMEVDKGRFINTLDHQLFYCVIGANIQEKLKAQGIKNPIGQQIQIGSWIFTIAGVLKPWTSSLFMYADVNNGFIVPLETTYLLSKDVAIHDVLIRLKPHANMSRVENELSTKLGILFPDKNLNFRNPNQILEVIQKQRMTFTLLLSSIGSIALVVGGIGVMNIMLVSVVERRKEIGLRMAIGAKRNNILHMFLIESIILTIFGGLLGIVIGLLISYILALMSGWEIHFYFFPPFLGFMVSLLVGVISGFYPAFRASRLDPIQTLQSE